MWECNTLEMLRDFARESMRIETVRMFMEHFELNMYALPSCLRNATNLVLVHSEVEYTFTSDDLMWLSNVENVAMCQGDARNLFFLELVVDQDEYYISCAAAIKLFDAAFPGNNQFIFKIGDSLASGCKRDFAKQIANNFCVTQLFPLDELEAYVYFLEEALFSDEESLPYLVIQYSPQEKLPEPVSNKRRDISFDYILFLREIASIYGVDTTKEYARYVGSFTQLKDCTITYADACNLLHFVGECSDISSYDVLEDALNQIKHAQTEHRDSVPINLTQDDKTTNFSPEAFDDAEKMLREMLGQ